VHAKHRRRSGSVGTVGWQVKFRWLGCRAVCCQLVAARVVGDGVPDRANLQGDQVVKLVPPVGGGG
jgi:molybdopterin converting factor small subunit